MYTTMVMYNIVQSTHLFINISPFLGYKPLRTNIELSISIKVVKLSILQNN